MPILSYLRIFTGAWGRSKQWLINFLTKNNKRLLYSVRYLSYTNIRRQGFVIEGG